VNVEVEGIWKENVVACLYYPGIFLEGLRKTTKNLSQSSRSPDRDINPEPPEYEAHVNHLTTTFGSALSFQLLYVWLLR
jgi:hypothetical protein